MTYAKEYYMIRDVHSGFPIPNRPLITQTEPCSVNVPSLYLSEETARRVLGQYLRGKLVKDGDGLPTSYGKSRNKEDFEIVKVKLWED